MPPHYKEGEAKGRADKGHKLEGEGCSSVIVEGHGVFGAFIFNVEGLRMVTAGAGRIQSPERADIQIADTIDDEHYKQSLIMISIREASAIPSCSSIQSLILLALSTKAESFAGLYPSVFLTI